MDFRPLRRTQSGISMTRRRMPSRRGFGLIEVLAAVMLLSVGLLAVLTAARAARETQSRAVNMSIARSIAQSKIEELRATPIGAMSPHSAVTTDSSLPDGNKIWVTVSRYPGVSEQDIYKAAVTVGWPEQRGTRTIEYETLIVRK